MDPNSASEELPALYRAVLDRVAEISAEGKRTVANEVRAEAIRIYSRAWDERARHDLESLLRRHSVDGLESQPARRGARRRPVRAA